MACEVRDTEVKRPDAVGGVYHAGGAAVKVEPETRGGRGVGDR